MSIELTERNPDCEKHYEELRKLTDGASESMTHEDAVQQIEYWRDRALREQAQPSKQVLENIDEVMSQAQVMASAWSLVGSRFDNGSAMQDFEEAKQELRDMLSASQAPEPVPHDNCVPVAVLVETDSGVMVWPIRDSAEACTYCDPNETPQMLYLHPAAPQAQPERKPMTSDEIFTAWTATAKAASQISFMAGARAAEAFHGITGDKS